MGEGMTCRKGPSNELCGNCGHPQAWHSHDDYACRVKHLQPCRPETAPCRCLGADVWAKTLPGGTPESRCGCPDFKREVVVAPAPPEEMS